MMRIAMLTILNSLMSFINCYSALLYIFYHLGGAVTKHAESQKIFYLRYQRITLDLF